MRDEKRIDKGFGVPVDVRSDVWCDIAQLGNDGEQRAVCFKIASREEFECSQNKEMTI
jgi:hypothetical protein